VVLSPPYFNEVREIPMQIIRVVSLLELLFFSAKGIERERVVAPRMSTMPVKNSGVDREYKAIPERLGANHPDLLEPLSIEQIPSVGENSNVTFEIRTREHRYLLSIQTRDAASGASVSFPVALPDLPGDHYRLKEVTRGVNYPVEEPYFYPGSYLRGETDRFGSTKARFRRWIARKRPLPVSG